MDLELGLDTFGDVTRRLDGTPVPAPQVLRDLLDEAVLADRVGVDSFGVGEHHRADFAVSAPEVVLAAIAARTERMRLGSAVTVLSSDDPVRVYERFATLDALSRGRAEVIVGRGSFTESFPLFGYDLAQYEELFEEKLDLLVRLLEEEPVTWRGTVRAPLEGLSAYPRTEGGHLPVWVGIGGNPESVVRAARYRLPLVIAVIGGGPARFVSHVELYERALVHFGAPRLPVAVHSPGYVAETDEAARETFFPHVKAGHDRIGAERGWGPFTREQFEREVDAGSMYVGSPETVARRIAETARTLGLARFTLKYSNGTLPHELMMRCVELYGSAVIPRVRELVAGPAPVTAGR